MKEKNLHYNKKGLLLSKKSFLERNILGLRNEGLLIFLVLNSRNIKSQFRCPDGLAEGQVYDCLQKLGRLECRHHQTLVITIKHPTRSMTTV